MVSIVFLLFDLGITAVYCGSDTLKYHVTLLSAPTPGVPQYSVIMYVNDVPYGRYNSDERRAQAFTPSLNVLSEHLETQTRIAQEYEIRQRHRMNFLMEILNKSKGDGDIHVYQRKCACELHDDGTINGYQEIAFDGNLLLIFDKEKVIYLPVTEEAITVAEQWNKLYDSTYAKINTEHECIEQLKIYLPYISTYLEKKVPPNVKISILESEISISKLHCWVYGFYPRDVEVKWIKNGRDEIYSEESAEILPNPDGTYQIRVSVEVTPEEGATYSCHVDHSSLEKTLVILFESHKKSRLYITTHVSVFLMIILGVFLCKNRMKEEPSHKSLCTEDGDEKSCRPSCINMSRLRNFFRIWPGLSLFHQNSDLHESSCLTDLNL